MIKNKSIYVFTILSLLILLVLSLSWGIVSKLQLDKSSRQISLETSLATFSEFNAQALVQHSHESLLAQMTPQMLGRYIQSLRRLGELVSLDSLSGTTTIALLPFNSQDKTASYKLTTQFSHAEAVIDIQLIYQQGRWQFTRYSVNSSLSAE
ncbi:MAG: hypothetical protein COC19_01200 [SAR86 cluster bacterium]|uniref:DUF4019 domain-containing protein n=1 Tax=SAR86 cluster bacterium TaxID=2030880 RepID=A0A2A4MTZ2_9GAMM|nr:MAG: hypothetical protein COC19_01200 [SAR86 cluster bacterium]